MAHGGASSVGSTSAHRPHLSTLESKHKVFLSHSGAQKGFVEQLCLDLERSDRYPFFDKRRDSLPIGENFPSLIFQAIKQCQVGVVILSKEYFTRSKWPMLELSALVKAQRENANMRIVPVFLDISREQCRDEVYTQQWVSKWHDWAREDNRLDVQDWVAALKVFGPINDLSCFDGTLGEVQCREEIVEAICNLVPSYTSMDDSYVQGKSRLCEVIHEKINKSQESLVYGVRVVGVYGMGGIGKTTACKALCNKYHMEFRGKVCHVELGNENEVALLQDMLKRLTYTKHELVKGFNADECHDRLKKDMHKQRVFLAIDNVSYSMKTIEQAMLFLRAGFGHGSIVIVTARSLDTLLALKIYESNCLEMPELEEAEARSLFLYHANFLANEGNEKIIFQHVERCRFHRGNGNNYHYHPLALKVLGLQIGFDSENWMLQSYEFDIFNQLRNGDEHPIFSILRKSFDTLLLEDQLLFMDVALFYPEFEIDVTMQRHGDYIFEWLSMIYGTCIDAIKKRLASLKRKALIEELGDGNTRIGMHDLWREFAIMETTRGKKKYKRWIFKVYNPDEIRPGDEFGLGGGWEDVERICLKANEGKYYKMKEVKLENFSSIKVLKLVRLDLANVKLDLGGLRHLKSLEIYFGFTSEPLMGIHGLGQLTNLVELIWNCANTQSFPMEDIGRLTNLQVLKLVNIKSSDKFPNLGKLTSLREVAFRMIDADTISGLSSRMTNLQYLDVGLCSNLRICHGVGDLVSLKVLKLSLCRKLEELANLHRLKNLQTLDLSYSGSITAIPGLEGLLALQELRLRGCEELTELVGLSQLTNLQCLDLGRTPLKAVSDVGCLLDLRSFMAHLERLEDWGELITLPKLRRVEIMSSNLQGLLFVAKMANLKDLTIRNCIGVDDLASLQNLTSLQELHLLSCDFKDVSSLRSLTSLQSLEISWCNELESLPDMQELIRLESFEICSCEKLRVWSSLEVVATVVHIGWTLPQLQCLMCYKVPLTEFPDLSNFPRLKTLDIEFCENLISLTSSGHLTTLEAVNLWGCRSLKALPDFSSSKRLRRFTLEDCVAKLNSHMIKNLEAMCPWLELEITGIGEIREIREIEDTELEQDAKRLKIDLNQYPESESDS